VPSGQTPPTYIQLFQLVRQSTTTDDDAWRITLALNNEEYRQLKKYLVDKLYAHISSQPNNSPYAEIRKWVKQAEACLERSLFSQALLALSQAEDIAVTYSLTSEHLVVLDWQIRIYTSLEQYQEIEDLAIKSKELALTLRTEKDLALLNTKAQTIGTEGLVLALSKYNQLPSITARFYLLNIISLITDSDPIQSSVQLQQIWSFWQTNPQLALSHSQYLIQAVWKLGLRYLQLNKPDQLKTLIEQLELIQNVTDKATYHFAVTTLKTEYAISKGNTLPLPITFNLPQSNSFHIKLRLLLAKGNLYFGLPNNGLEAFPTSLTGLSDSELVDAKCLWFALAKEAGTDYEARYKQLLQTLKAANNLRLIELVKCYYSGTKIGEEILQEKQYAYFSFDLGHWLAYKQAQ
jgi:hypothetical protein